MEHDDLAGRYRFALELIRDAGRLAQGFFEKREALTIKTKGLQDLASEADLNTELLIRERLEKAYPADAFLGEETGLSQYSPGQGIWVVDPIDGTQPFVCGLSSWCVSIAFVSDGLIRFGMVYAPARDELFAGGRDFGATLNGAPVERHPGNSVREGITGFGYSPRVGADEVVPIFERLLSAGGTFYRDGSGALCLCYVAAGRLIGYIERHINSWDCLGALAVIEGAGLATSDFLAGDGLRKGNPLVAAKPEAFAELEAILRGT